MSKLLTLNQVSNQIGFSESSIRRYLKAGEFPLPLKKGRSIRWSAEEVQEWIDSLPRMELEQATLNFN